MEEELKKLIHDTYSKSKELIDNVFHTLNKDSDNAPNGMKVNQELILGENSYINSQKIILNTENINSSGGDEYSIDWIEYNTHNLVDSKENDYKLKNNSNMTIKSSQ